MKVPFQKSTDGEKTWMDGTILSNSYDHLKEHSQKKIVNSCHHWELGQNHL